MRMTRIVECLALSALVAWPAAARQDASPAVAGVVRLKGKAPEAKKFDPGRFEAIRKLYPDGVPYRPVETDADQNIRWAFVYVKAGLEGRTFDSPKEPKSLDLEKAQFSPRVLGLMVGQPLIMTNRDDEYHSVRGSPANPDNKGKEFNAGLPTRGMSKRLVLDAPEQALKVTSSDGHLWETAWVFVLSHPYFAVTDEKGRFEIRGLPPGKYTLEAWQEHCRPVTQAVEVGEAAAPRLTFDLPAAEKK